jgi:hypothetical protein
VAYPESEFCHGGTDNPGDVMGSETLSQFGNGNRPEVLADAALKFGYGRDDQLNQRKIRERETIQDAFGGGDRVRYNGNDWWQNEPGMGRVVDGVPSLVDRLKCLGNAVVPQVAEVVGHLVRIHANDY